MEQKQKDLQQLAPHVYVLPMEGEYIMPTVGAVVTETQTVLIDCGNSPLHAREVLAALERIGAPKVKTIIYTHHHWDHSFGACQYEDVEVIGSERTARYMEEQAAMTWNAAHLEQEMRERPEFERSHRAKLACFEGEWDSFRVVVPARTFADRLTLDVDGLTLELKHVGGHHADDSITVRVVEEGVMFLGDCFYMAPMTTRQPDDRISWEMILEVGDPSVRQYVHGHGDVLDPDEVRELVEKIEQRR